jgi:hypothetical protein
VRVGGACGIFQLENPSPGRPRHPYGGMPRIHIREDGVESDVEASALQRLETIRENPEQIVRTVEYCRLTCDGVAHQTGIADDAAYFCRHHVHRSLAVDVKRWPVEAGAIAGGF